MNNVKKLDNILNEFLSREIDTTDARILSIRYFIQTLELGVEKEFSTIIDKNSPERAKLLSLINDMVAIYEGEIDTLMLKRNKISEHLPIIRSSMLNDEMQNNKLINPILN